MNVIDLRSDTVITHLDAGVPDVDAAAARIVEVLG